MNARIVFGVVFAVLLVGAARAAESFDQAMTRAATEYREQMIAAAEELNRTRESVMAERTPLLAELQAVESRILEAEAEVMRFETEVERAAEQRRTLLKELDAIRRNTSYMMTLAQEGIKALEDGAAPGEEQISGETWRALQSRNHGAGAAGKAALGVAKWMAEYVERALGGYVAEGRALRSDTNELVNGTYVFVGPETFFRAYQNDFAGTVRTRSGSDFPVVYPLPNWRAEDAAAFVQGEPSVLVSDATGGKALRLRETMGSWWDHVRKGGVVAYAIIAVGLLAVVLIVQKIRDASKMRVDGAADVNAFLHVVARGSRVEAREALNRLRPTTRDLFAIGLEHRDESKAVIEEQLEAVLLRQRLHFERRLPLLAVIATAAPLMGLLGTVMGMVKTFALITVFGTGNAAKLSSGISEVLVATELGLIVAIPALVAHGFLSHRIQKNLSQLERYALQFITAARQGNGNRLRGEEDAEESVPA